MSEPPDYLDYIEHTKVIARTITSIQSCKRLGFNVIDRPTVPNDITNSALRRAALEGIDIKLAESMLLDALREEQQRQELIAKVPAEADTEDELIAFAKETIGYWGKRCADLAEHSVANSYIRHTTPAYELEALTKQIDTVVSGIKKAFEPKVK
jgi:hypothetical protein